MKLILGSILVWAFVIELSAQSYQPYSWQNSRTLFELTDNEKEFQEYIVKLHRQYDYDWENKNLIVFITDHKITKVQTTNAIERHNRIYIPLNNTMEIMQLKARAINKSGKVTNFDTKNLKEIKDDNTNNIYKIFAIEGVEPESEIEYFYTVKANGRTADTYFYQYETPVKNFDFKLTCPKSLHFEFRHYNDNPSIQKDTLSGKNIYSFTSTNIPDLHEEAFALLNPNRKRVEIKLTYNFTSTNSRLNTWADAAKTFYRILSQIDKDVEKDLEKFVKTIGDNPKLSLAQRIQQIENKVKEYIRINTNSADPDLDDLSKILKSRQASSDGMTKLFLLTFEKLSIPVELVITSDREVAFFDPSFDSWTFLDEYLLYFPDTQDFLVPYNFDLRYPLIPNNLYNQKGLFIEPVVVSGIKTAIPWIREIPAKPYTYDLDNLDIKVDFDTELENIYLKHKRTFIGYDAAYAKYYYEAISEKERLEYVTDLIKTTVPDIQFDEWNVKTTSQGLLPVMDIYSSCKTNHFIERAGNRVIFKVGELIGPQSELYNEEERTLPVENFTNRGYVRKIIINIPKGYRATNLEALNFNVTCTIENRIPFLFQSQYKLNGNQLSIDIEEYYKELTAPLKKYEDFRKVINAAADFNKVNIVLVKE